MHVGKIVSTRTRNFGLSILFRSTLRVEIIQNWSQNYSRTFWAILLEILKIFPAKQAY